MTVQLSADIDEATKQKFDMVCEAMGVSPSNAISMFVSGVITSNSIPSISAAQPPKPKMSREEAMGCMRGKIWMAEDFDAPMALVDEKDAPPLPKPKMPLKEVPDCMHGQFWMSDDFDAPLEDFKDYM